MAQRRNGTTAQWRNGARAQRHNGAMAQGLKGNGADEWKVASLLRFSQ
jgi:hypothetical protein